MDSGDIRVFEARRDAYRLLSMFLALPSKETAGGIVEGALQSDVLQLAVGLGFSEMQQNELALVARQDVGEEGCADFEDQIFVRLRRDYTRLFTNPEHAFAPIYEACFKGSDDFDTSSLTFISPTAIDAEKIYKAWGLKPAGESNESPDHMGAQTQFMSFLYDRLGDACEREDAGRALEIERAIASFVARHLAKWGVAFFEQVTKHAQTSTYCLIGLFGCYLIQGEGLLFDKVEQ